MYFGTDYNFSFLTAKSKCLNQGQIMQGYYKWCEGLYKFIGKNVIATEKLNSHVYEWTQKN
jgi:hypothetical protein